MRLKVSSGKWRPFCLGLNVLKMFVQSHRVLHSQLFFFTLEITICWNKLKIAYAES